MESIEFLDILNTYLPTDSEVYYINYQKPDHTIIKDVYLNKLKDFYLSKVLKDGKLEKNSTKAIEEEFSRSFKYIECRDGENNQTHPNKHSLSGYEKKQINEVGELQHDNSMPPLGRLFNYVYSKIWISFKKEYRPQHIHRHKLVSLLFFNPNLRKPNCDYNYPSTSDVFNSKNNIKKKIDHQ